jgi:hypothetical protein
MQSKLKSLHSLEIDLGSYIPVEADDFSIDLRAMIGSLDSQGEESFDIHVCTPKWLLQHCQEPLWGRHMLIVPHYDIQMIKAAIDSYCQSCSGQNWNEVSLRLSRIGKWEFEDYRP